MTLDEPARIPQMAMRRSVDVEVRSKVFLVTGGIVLLLCVVPWFDHRSADNAVVQDGMLQSPDRLYVVSSETMPISLEPSQLVAQGTATAEAVSLLPQENGVRIEITDGGAEDWQLGWNACYLEVDPGTPLTLRFTARAAEPRSMRCELSQNHEPWQSLGLNQSVELTRDWKTYEVPFRTTSTAGATTESARLCFHVGGTPISVELRDLSLERSAVEPAPQQHP